MTSSCGSDARYSCETGVRWVAGGTRGQVHGVSARARASRAKMSGTTMSAKWPKFVSGGRLRLRSAGRHSPPPRCVRTRTRDGTASCRDRRARCTRGTRPGCVHHESHNLDRAPAHAWCRHVWPSSSRAVSSARSASHNARAASMSPPRTRREGAPTRRDPRSRASRAPEEWRSFTV